MSAQNQQPEHTQHCLLGTREDFDSIQRVILSAMERLDFGEDALFAVRISLEEGLANALLHGHQGDEEKEIEVNWYCDAVAVGCEIVDKGRGYDPESIPDPTADENLTLPSGRGLAMIRAFMDEVTVNEQGNRVIMKRYKARLASS
ncbi:MAG: anti-sigma regulatory factor [Phycisphaerae bacterium]|nr:anti-sigma regulatory factor [Phycisphaerae bacterium]|tara:strand:- start:81 stop:518 length:438 start_codon:yes stop_codon:yes gene_type:complete